MRVPLLYFAIVMFALSLAGVAVVFFRPPFCAAMVFYALQISFCLLFIARGLAEIVRRRNETT